MIELATTSALLVLAVCSISVPAGAMIGWLTVRTDLPGRRTVALLLATMLLVPLYLQAAAWQAVLGWKGWLSPAGVTSHGFMAAVWIHALAAIPASALMAAAGFLAVDCEQEEAASLDARPVDVFFRITLRGAWPGLMSALLWVAVTTAGEMTVTDLFAVRTYAEELYTRLALGDTAAEVAAGMAPGIAGTAVLVAALLAAVHGLAGGRYTSMRSRPPWRLGAWRLPCFLAAAGLLIVVIGVPLASLLYKAGVVVRSVDGHIVRQWSAGKAVVMVALGPWDFRRELLPSIGVAALAATTAQALSLPLCAGLAARRWRRWLVFLTAAASMATPGPMIGLALIGLLNQPQLPLIAWLYDQSILAPWLVLTFRALGPVLLVIWYASTSIPPEQLDAAAIDGAGKIATLAYVVLPQRRYAMALAWLIGFAVAIGDLGATILVLPPGLTTLSVRVFGLLHYGVEDRVAGIALAQMAATAALAIAIVRLVARVDRSRC